MSLQRMVECPGNFAVFPVVRVNRAVHLRLVQMLLNTARSRLDKSTNGDRAMNIIMIVSLMMSAGATLALLNMLWPE